LLMNQDIGEGYNLVEQQFLLDIILNGKPEEKIDIRKMKDLVKDVAAQLQEDKEMKGNYDILRDGLKAQVVIIDEKIKARREAEEKAAADKAAAAVKEENVATAPAEGDKKPDDKKDGDKKDEKSGKPEDKKDDKDGKKSDDKDDKKDDKKEDKPAEVKPDEKAAGSEKPVEPAKEEAKEAAEEKK